MDQIDPSIPLQTRGVGPITSIAQTMEQAERLRLARESSLAAAENRRSQAALREQQTARYEQENADRAAAGQAIQQGGGVREQTLAWAREKAPNTVPGLTKFFDESDEKANTIKKAKLEIANHEADFFGDLADSILQHGQTPEALPGALQLGMAYALEQFPDFKPDIERLQGQLAQAPPDQVKAFLTQIRDQAPSRRVTPAEVRAREEHAAKLPGIQAQSAVQAQVAAGTVGGLTPEQQATAARANATATETARHNRAAEATAAARAAGSNAGAGDGLDASGQELLATQYRIIGSSAIPTRISGADRARIVNQAAAQMKTLGQSPVMAIQRQAARKADAGSLTKITSMASTAEAFENKAIQQADLVRELSARVDRSRFPILNQALLSGKKDILGDADTQMLYNALTTFTAEYAKIIEGSTGSAAGSSDAARRASASLASAAMNKDTLAKTLDLMQKEMRYTIQGYDATIDHITTRMGGAPAAPVAAAPTQAAPAQGMIRAVDPQGNVHEAKAGTPLPAGWKLQGGG